MLISCTTYRVSSRRGTILFKYLKNVFAESALSDVGEVEGKCTAAKGMVAETAPDAGLPIFDPDLCPSDIIAAAVRCNSYPTFTHKKSLVAH